MQGQNKEHWRELCERVIVEQDSKKLLELTREIIRLLDEKEARLKGNGSPEPSQKSNSPP